jgi:hypothetical protein
MFVNGIGDLRGEHELTPRSFAQAATAQPEFGACVADRVSSHVFGRSATPDEKVRVQREFDKTGLFRSAMRVALTDYAEQCTASASAATAPAPPPSIAANGAALDLPASLGAQLSRSCVSCHTWATEAKLEPKRMRKMLDKVTAFEMPKPPVALTPDSRLLLTKSLVDVLFPSAEREAAQRYSEARLSGHVESGALMTLDTHRPSTALAAVRRAAGASQGFAWPHGYFVEESLPGGFTPGFTTAIAIEALTACKRAGKTGAALEECLDRATDPGVVER